MKKSLLNEKFNKYHFIIHVRVKAAFMMFDFELRHANTLEKKMNSIEFLFDVLNTIINTSSKESPDPSNLPFCDEAVEHQISIRCCNDDIVEGYMDSLQRKVHREHREEQLLLATKDNMNIVVH